MPIRDSPSKPSPFLLRVPAQNRLAVQPQLSGQPGAHTGQLGLLVDGPCALPKERIKARTPAR